MKKYLSQLRPMERRLVVAVGIGLVVALNWAFIWPHLHDWGDYERRLGDAQFKLKNYQTAVAKTDDLKKKVGKYESQGDYVAPEDQALNLMRTIQQQSATCGVALQDISHPNTKTNDVFFVEQYQTVNVLGEEKNLVDFLYKLSEGLSMIRVRDLTLQPDAPHQRLLANIRLVASYQKNPASPAAKTDNAKAK